MIIDKEELLQTGLEMKELFDQESPFLNLQKELSKALGAAPSF